MQCADFLDRLGRLLGGELSSEQRQQCESHLAGCDTCLDIWLSKNGLDAVLSAESAQALTTNILKSTELDPCQACEELLCDYVDESLSQTQRHFLELHLETCEACKNTAHALAAVSEDLVLLAVVQPEIDLSNAILKKTLSPHEPMSIWKWIPRYSFQRLVRRPRFSLEASFAATILWMTLFGAPSSFSIAIEAEQLVTVDTSQVQQTIANAQTNLNEGVNKIPELVTSGIGSLGSISTQIIESGLVASQQRGRGAWQEIQAWFNNFEFSLNDSQN